MTIQGLKIDEGFSPAPPPAGGPALTISACTIPVEGAPSLRFLQGWAAMMPVPFDFVGDF
jgi:hypothetical protein